MRALPSRIVRFFDAREPPTSLALVRIATGATLFYDLARIGQLGLVDALFAPGRAGGLGFSVLTPVLGVHGTWLVALIAAAALTVGLASRGSAVVLLVCSASLARTMPEADRGIDLLLRWVLLLLALSGAGATLSLDARLVHGAFVPKEVRVPSWPRRLLVWQLCVVYFFAGVQKQDLAWTFEGDYAALWRILHDPHYATRDLHAILAPLSPLTQLATIATLAFERTAILVPLCLSASATPHRGGPLRRLAARSFWLWLATGIGLHLGIALTMNLGIFPWAMLGLYPAFLRPSQITFWGSLPLGPTARDRGASGGGFVNPPGEPGP